MDVRIPEPVISLKEKERLIQEIKKVEEEKKNMLEIIDIYEKLTNTKITTEGGQTLFHCAMKVGTREEGLDFDLKLENDEIVYLPRSKVATDHPDLSFLSDELHLSLIHI
eukprot:TRINITY_DN4768_c0_g3_i2.p1 TRINITY_DN4768_c0_g3~~TRINITY_DN4768_c0_g3_i2.p1  ORF type:complete len:110 (+),score=32.29 TRINITY_DN4768_c0_g3_i2:534-863(+)